MDWIAELTPFHALWAFGFLWMLYRLASRKEP